MRALRTRPLPRWDSAVAVTLPKAARVPAVELISRPAAEDSADRRIALLEVRAAVAASANESGTAAGALRACLREFSTRLGWPVARAVLVDARGRATGAPIWHTASPTRHDGFRAALTARAVTEGDGPAARAIAAGAPVWTELGSDYAARAAGLRAAAAFPVRAAGGLAAVVELYADRAEPADPAVLDACAFAARQLCAALERIAERDALRDGADTLRALVDGSPTPVACFDAEGALAFWSPAAEQLLGFTAAEAAARALRPGIDAGWGELVETAARVLATGEPVAATLRWRRADGRTREMEARCTPLLNADGTVRGAAAHLVDRAAPAAEGGQSREQLLALVSHDLRNPLHVISIASGALLRGWPCGDENAPERVQLAAIAQSADRARRLVADLMDAAQQDSGTFAVCPQPLPVSTLVRRAAEAHAPLAAEKGVSIEVAALPSTLAMADEHRVYQVFSNLIGNALRFTPAGGSVTLSAAVEGGVVRLSVADTGSGIAADDLPRIFERFWQGTRCRGGAGLGLSITRAIVEAHGGRAWAESTPGQGATLSFTLPLADPILSGGPAYSFVTATA
ncbi:MAG TPA: HAMP domain-containing sensor histidine kinase [Longimicrobium sp.]|nr:HAMP domain-containing sensor histidine kinase [Longimicrobium sp.]